MRLALLLTALSPAEVLACAVCGGADPSSGLSRGIVLGIYILLASVFSLLAVLVTAIIKIEKGRSLAEGRQQ
jgi:hypothetical protein